MPRLCECDPLTGQVIRASKTTTIRYEREHPGELVHMDVKKLGRIPDGGGWRASPPSGHTGRCSSATPNAPPRLHHGFSTTTLIDATQHSAADHPSADFSHQRDGRVQLAASGQRSAGTGGRERNATRPRTRERPHACLSPPGVRTWVNRTNSVFSIALARSA